MVVKWSTCSPSTLLIPVHIPLKSTVSIPYTLFEQNENKQKRPGMAINYTYLLPLTRFGAPGLKINGTIFVSNFSLPFVMSSKRMMDNIPSEKREALGTYLSILKSLRPKDALNFYDEKL